MLKAIDGCGLYTTARALCGLTLWNVIGIVNGPGLALAILRRIPIYNGEEETITGSLAADRVSVMSVTIDSFNQSRKVGTLFCNRVEYQNAGTGQLSGYRFAHCSRINVQHPRLSVSIVASTEWDVEFRRTFEVVHSNCHTLRNVTSPLSCQLVIGVETRERDRHQMWRIDALACETRLTPIQALCLGIKPATQMIDPCLSVFVGSSALNHGTQRVLVAPGQERFCVSSQPLRSIAAGEPTKLAMTRNGQPGKMQDISNAFGGMSLEPKKIIRLTMICMRLNESHQAELLVDCLQKMKDVSVILLIEASEVDIRSVEELLGSHWSNQPLPVKDADKKSVCFLKKEHDEINVHRQQEAMIHLRITKSEPDEKVNNINVFVVNQKNKNHFEQFAKQWMKISNAGPAIAIGDFKAAPNYIQKKLGRVFFAFVNRQQLTRVEWDTDAEDKPQTLWCTQNAIANGCCNLGDFYNRKVDGVNNTLLAVRYMCHVGKLMKGRQDEKLKNLEGVKLAYANAGQQCNSKKVKSGSILQRSKADRIEIIKEMVQKIRDDVNVIAVVQTNKARDRKLLKSVLGSDWQDDGGFFSTTNILCFWNKKVLGESARFRIHHGRFVSLEVPYTKDGHRKVLNIMIVHLPRSASSGDTTSDVRDQALNDARIYWDHIVSKGPAIAIGDFNLTPGEIHELFENGSVAFKTGQLQTNSKVNKRFTDNVYANSACELLSFYIEEADGLEHKAFLVHYKPL